MKGAAKCDKHCELQNSVNQQVLERILRFRDIPESMPASVSIPFHSLGSSFIASLVRVSVRQGARSLSREPPLTHAVHGDLSAASNLKSVLGNAFSVAARRGSLGPDLEPLVRLPFQDMKLGQQTR